MHRDQHIKTTQMRTTVITKEIQNSFMNIPD